MNNKTLAKGSFSPVLIILVIIILIPVLLIVGRNIGSQAEYNRLQDEISRVESETGIKALSADCRDGSLAPVCYVEYETLSDRQVKSMLSRSGYTFEDSSSGEIMSAKNIKTNTSVGIEIGDKSQPTIIRYKDIDVTL